MSNVKWVDIEARVPFNWLDRYDGPLTDEDVAFIGRTFAGPSIGLRLRYTEDGYEPNSRGGRTAMYLANIEGEEAVAWPFLDGLLEVIERAGGTLVRALAADLEDGVGGEVDLIAERDES